MFNGNFLDRDGLFFYDVGCLWIWIFYGLEILEDCEYGLDLELEINPSCTSAHRFKYIQSTPLNRALPSRAFLTRLSGI